MNLASFISAITKLFNDILGSIIPRLLLICGLRYMGVYEVFLAPELVSSIFSDNTILIVITAFMLGHLLDQLYLSTLHPFAGNRFLLAVALVLFWRYLFVYDLDIAQIQFGFEAMFGVFLFLQKQEILPDIISNLIAKYTDRVVELISGMFTAFHKTQDQSATQQVLTIGLAL